MSKAPVNLRVHIVTDKGETFRVHRCGPREWYVQHVVSGELVSPTFATRKAAQAAVDRRNERRREQAERERTET